MFMLAIDLRRTCTLEDSGLFPELAQGGRGWEEKDRSSPNARDLRSECPKLRSRTGNRTFPFWPAASVSRPNRSLGGAFMIRNADFPSRYFHQATRGRSLAGAPPYLN